MTYCFKFEALSWVDQGRVVLQSDGIPWSEWTTIFPRAFSGKDLSLLVSQLGPSKDLPYEEYKAELMELFGARVQRRPACMDLAFARQGDIESVTKSPVLARHWTTSGMSTICRVHEGGSSVPPKLP